MGTVARVVFRYDGDPHGDQAVLDLDAVDSKLKCGSIIERNSQWWKIRNIEVERATDEPNQPPIWRVYLGSPTAI